MMDFLHQSSDNFRIIYNGLAGASIEVHEHFQTTSICFPVESICYNHQDILYARKNLWIIKPKYYLPLWIVEGDEQSKMISILDHLIKKWHSQKPNEYTENILAVKNDSLFRFFVFLRERSKLKTMEHVSALATFEAAGLFVFSDFLKKCIEGKSGKDFFSSLTLDIITNMLKKIAPNDNLTLDTNKDLENI
jgi:hypothetical protein